MPASIPDTSIETLNLKFEQTVPRSLVHKRAIENVLLAEAIAIGEDRFLCAGRIPTAHSFFNHSGRTPHQDILFYTEMGRQASLAVSHSFLGVSKSEVFIFEQSKASISEAAWSSGLQLPAECVVTEIKIQETQRRKNNAITRVVAEHTMWIGNEAVFHGTGAWNMQPAALFQRLRRMGGMTAPAREAAGSFTTSALGPNVVITVPEFDSGRDEFTSTLIVDQTHPYFFDHPCDHVPGMLLLEGCAQLAASITGETEAGRWVVSAYQMNFEKFIETHLPTVLVARRTAAGVEISVRQRDAVCGTAALSVVAAR